MSKESDGASTKRIGSSLEVPPDELEGDPGYKIEVNGTWWEQVVGGWAIMDSGYKVSIITIIAIAAISMCGILTTGFTEVMRIMDTPTIVVTLTPVP